VTDSLSDNHWQQLGSETLLVTPWLEVRREHVIRHDGRSAAYDVVWIPRDVVVVVPVRARREILMLRQFRQPTRRMSYEVPAGGMEPGETPERAARRELMEETGWDCPGVRLVRPYHPISGRCNVCFNILHAPDPVHVGDPTDPSEAEEVLWADRERFGGLWKAGAIHEGATVTALLLAFAMGWLEWDLAGIASQT
jgi:8-oxo-dGTP pyrophosphatase MutT (NUDIX family)